MTQYLRYVCDKKNFFLFAGSDSNAIALGM